MNSASRGYELTWDHPLFDATGWTLVHFVWQAFAIAIMVAMLLALLRSASAQSRYLVAFF